MNSILTALPVSYGSPHQTSTITFVSSVCLQWSPLTYPCGRFINQILYSANARLLAGVMLWVVPLDHVGASKEIRR